VMERPDPEVYHSSSGGWTVCRSTVSQRYLGGGLTVVREVSRLDGAQSTDKPGILLLHVPTMGDRALGSCFHKQLQFDLQSDRTFLHYHRLLS